MTTDPKPVKLTNHELEEITEAENATCQLIKSIDSARQFKFNDYLICARTYEDTKHRTYLSNSYGTKIKFRVVHIDKNGMPWVKEVGSNGEVRGHVQAVAEIDTYGYSYETLEWEHDPHFVEAIILSADGEYDPTEVQRKKKAERDVVVKHNAAAKVKSQDTKSLIAAFETMAAGQTWWFSTKNGMLINKINFIAPPKNGRYRGMKTIRQIEVTLSNGKIAKYIPEDFLFKNLYNAQPKRLKEQSDSI